ncbi:hypothetical protein ACWEPZ_13400 [Streptomyces sp. NPDC004288]
MLHTSRTAQLLVSASWAGLGLGLALTWHLWGALGAATLAVLAFPFRTA